MRSLFLFLIFTLFLGWVALTRKYYVCEIKKSCGDISIVEKEIIRPKTLDIKFQDSLILENYEQFHFRKDSMATLFTENNIAFLNQIANYLNSVEDRQTTITGLFRESEANLQQGSFENIGTARAATIREYLMDRGVDGERIMVDSKPSQGEDLFEPISFSILEYAPPEFIEEAEE